VVDFRYHIVSIVAVFLALGLGIVLGTYTINSQIIKHARHEVHALRQQKDSLQNQILTLQSQTGNDAHFLSGLAPWVLHGRLAHQRVVVFEAPNAQPSIASAVSAAVVEAGGTVTATVKLANNWINPAESAILDDLATRLVEPGLRLPVGTAADRAAYVVCATLVTKHPPAVVGSRVGGLTAPQTTALAGFTEAKLLSVSPQHPTRGTLAVMIGSAAPAKPDATDQAAVATVASFAEQLVSTSAGTVIVGPTGSASSGGLVNAVRSSIAGHESAPSSVDDADTPSGVLVTVLALAEERRGIHGQYGLGKGASAPVPSPGATPVPTPTG
jgi:copper transport outer membrane protein MctB